MSNIANKAVANPIESTELVCVVSAQKNLGPMIKSRKWLEAFLR